MQEMRNAKMQYDKSYFSQLIAREKYARNEIIIAHAYSATIHNGFPGGKLFYIFFYLKLIKSSFLEPYTC